MPELKVKISTEAEMGEAKALEGQLEKSIFRAKALGKEFGETQKQLDGLRNGMTEYTAVNGVAEKSTNPVKDGLKKLGMSFTDLKKGLKDLKHEVPGLGILLHALKNPIVGLIAVGGLAIAGVIRHFHKLKEEADKLAEDIRSATGRQEKAWESVKDGAYKYKVELGELANKAQSAAEKLVELNEASDFKKSAAMEKLKARRDLALAEVEAGSGSEVDKTRKKLRIKAEYERDVVDMDNAATKERLGNEEKAYEQANEDKAKYAKQLEHVDEQLKYSKGVEAKRQGVTDKSRDAVVAAEAHQAKVEKRLQPSSPAEAAYFKQLKEESAKKIQVAKDELAANVKRDDAAKKNITDLEADKKRIEAGLTKATDTALDLERKMPKNRQRAADEMNNREEVWNINRTAGGLTAQEEVRKAQEAEEKKAEAEAKRVEAEKEKEAKRLEKMGKGVWKGKNSDGDFSTDDDDLTSVENGVNNAADSIESIMLGFDARLKQIASRIDANRGAGES